MVPDPFVIVISVAVGLLALAVYRMFTTGRVFEEDDF